mgnify:CR=1 FL=1
MKFLVISFFCILGATGYCHAGWFDTKALPVVNEHVSNSVGIASNTAAVTSSMSVVISSYSAEFYRVVINKPGFGSKLELFNSNITTIGISGRLIATIDTTTATWYGAPPPFEYNVWCDSGLTHNNSGLLAADVTLVYRIGK